MPLRLAFASTVTLGVLVGGLISVLFLAAVIVGLPSHVLWILMIANLAFTIGMWVAGPYIMDLSLRWFYRCSFMDFDAFERRNPNVGAFLREVCDREGMPLPQIRIIHDDNPTAYTYGTIPWNSRVALSDGLFRFCSEREVQAVAAHELGHIRHYDFAVMTLATALLQLLYEVYFYTSRSRGEGDGEGRAALRYVGLGAYALWWLGTYLVLWLSRTREYMADAFAAEQMGDAAPLQRALVKIAYGLAEVQAMGDEEAKGGRLLQATRALGIADPKASGPIGRAVATASAGGRHAVQGNVALQDEPSGAVATSRKLSFDARTFEPVLAFDLVNPWALVSELGSTHPLTGKRLRALEEINAELGRPQLFDFERIEDQDVDETKLWSDFSFEVVIYYLPWILGGLGIALTAPFPWLGKGPFMLGVGVGLVVRGIYSYASPGEFEPTNVFALMCDPYASPLRGRPVTISGEIVGKGNPGAKYSEDLMMKDRSGALIHLDYQSAWGRLGNLFFGATSAKRMIGRGVKVRGWFRRGVSQNIDVYDLEVTGMGRIGSYNRAWQIGGGVFITILGALFLAIAMSLPDLPEPGDEDGWYDDEAGDEGGEKEPYQIPSLDP